MTDDNAGKIYGPDGVSILSVSSGEITDPLREVLCTLMAWVIGVEQPPSPAHVNKLLEEATEIVGIDYMKRRFAGKINIRNLTPEEVEANRKVRRTQTMRRVK